MIEFTWIWALAFLPLPIVVYFLLPAASKQESALYMPFYSHIASLSQREVASARHSQWLKKILAVLIWCLLVIAACRPQWIGDPIKLPTSGRDLMLAVDISTSMDEVDIKLHGKQARRIEVVKSVVGDFVNRRKGDRLGLILFAAKPYVQAPLTFDRNTVDILLKEADTGMIEDATAIGDGIGLAVQQLRKRPDESRILILLSDGANNAGELEPLKAAEIAQKEQVKIYTIGIGADEMVKRTFFFNQRVNPSRNLDEKTLTKVAEMTGGKYFRARDMQQLEQIYQELDKLEPIIQSEETFRPVKSLFYWPLGIALVLSFLLALVSLSVLSLLSNSRNKNQENYSSEKNSTVGI